MNREDVDKCLMARCVVGSTSLGLNGPDSDIDEMGLCVEPLQEAIGIGNPFEQWTSPTEDVTIYSLRKWCRLVLKGNPTVMALLWIPPHFQLQGDARFSQLQELAPHFVSRNAGRAYLGYMQAQRMRMTGERGHGRHGHPRSELVEQFGFDTKYAMHMLRLGFQGVELQQTGRLSFPIPEPTRHYLLDVRTGRISFQDCLTQAGELEGELKDLISSGPLPDMPDVGVVEGWMCKTYLRWWYATRTLQDHHEDYHTLGRGAFEALDL